MKLYDVPRDSIIVIKDKDIRIPPCSLDIPQNSKLKFYYIDGMYSCCETEDGQIVYPVAWTEVEIVEKQ